MMKKGEQAFINEKLNAAWESKGWDKEEYNAVFIGICSVQAIEAYGSHSAALETVLKMIKDCDNAEMLSDRFYDEIIVDDGEYFTPPPIDSLDD